MVLSFQVVEDGICPCLKLANHLLQRGNSAILCGSSGSWLVNLCLHTNPLTYPKGLHMKMYSQNRAEVGLACREEGCN